MPPEIGSQWQTYTPSLHAASQTRSLMTVRSKKNTVQTLQLSDKLYACVAHGQVDTSSRSYQELTQTSLILNQQGSKVRREVILKLGGPHTGSASI